MPTYLIDGVTPLPENGETGWGNKLNTAITEIDDRFTWTSGEAVAAKVAASGITGTTLPVTLVSSSLTSVGTLTGLAVSGNVTITGDFTVNGTTTTINTTTLNVSDNFVVLNNDVTGSPTENAGIEIERGTSTNVQIRWNETSDKWELTNDGLAYSELGAASALTGSTLASGVTASSLTSVGTIATGVWQGTAVAGQYGGTGVANTGKTITVSGNTTIGSSTHTVAFTTSGNTSVALPTTGTVATLAGSESLTNKKLGSLTSNGLVTTSGGDGTLSVTASTGSGNVVLASNAAMTSPAIETSITTSSTSFDLVNTTASTVNFAGSAATVNIGGIASTTEIDGALNVSNTLTVSGPTILGPSVVTQKSTTTYTLALADQGKVLETTHASGCTITIPPEGSVNFPVGSQIMVVRNSSGSVQFQAGAGVTLRSDASKFFISTQYSAVTLIKRGADEWYLVGNLAAS